MRTGPFSFFFGRGRLGLLDRDPFFEVVAAGAGRFRDDLGAGKSRRDVEDDEVGFAVAEGTGVGGELASESESDP